MQLAPAITDLRSGIPTPSGLTSVHVFDEDEVEIALDLKTSTTSLQIDTPPVAASEGRIAIGGFSENELNHIPFGEWTPSWAHKEQAALYFLPPATIDKPETHLTYQLPLRRLTASVTFVGDSQSDESGFTLERPYGRVRLSESPETKGVPFDNVLVAPGTYEISTPYPQNVVGCVSVK